MTLCLEDKISDLSLYRVMERLGESNKSIVLDRFQRWICDQNISRSNPGHELQFELTGLEGFFVLESSIYDDPENFLNAYKNRNHAEKFIRDLKEEAELLPIQHRSKHAVIG